jgi:hypothetical protein
MRIESGEPDPLQNVIFVNLSNIVISVLSFKDTHLLAASAQSQAFRIHHITYSVLYIFVWKVFLVAGIWCASPVLRWTHLLG